MSTSQQAAHDNTDKSNMSNESQSTSAAVSDSIDFTGDTAELDFANLDFGDISDALLHDFDDPSNQFDDDLDYEDDDDEYTDGLGANPFATLRMIMDASGQAPIDPDGDLASRPFPANRR